MAGFGTSQPDIPAGMMMPWGGPAGSLPAGWLLANGAAISRTVYAALFGAIGTAYGAGDGSTTFNLPDARSRTVGGAGQGPGLSNRSRATPIGAETHQLVTGESPSHAHNVVTNCGNVTMNGSITACNITAPTFNRPTTSVGGDGAHSIMDPTIYAYWLMKF